jgi:hypothetical protein
MTHGPRSHAGFPKLADASLRAVHHPLCRRANRFDDVVNSFALRMTGFPRQPIPYKALTLVDLNV